MGSPKARKTKPARWQATNAASLTPVPPSPLREKSPGKPTSTEQQLVLAIRAKSSGTITSVTTDMTASLSSSSTVGSPSGGLVSPFRGNWGKNKRKKGVKGAPVTPVTPVTPATPFPEVLPTTYANALAFLERESRATPSQQFDSIFCPEDSSTAAMTAGVSATESLLLPGNDGSCVVPRAHLLSPSSSEVRLKGVLASSICTNGGDANFSSHEGSSNMKSSSVKRRVLSLYRPGLERPWSCVPSLTMSPSIQSNIMSVTATCIEATSATLTHKQKQQKQKQQQQGTVPSSMVPMSTPRGRPTASTNDVSAAAATVVFGGKAAIDGQQQRQRQRQSRVGSIITKAASQSSVKTSYSVRTNYSVRTSYSVPSSTTSGSASCYDSAVDDETVEEEDGIEAVNSFANLLSTAEEDILSEEEDERDG